MRNVNRVTLLGFVGRDPRAIGNGAILCVLTKEHTKTTDGWRIDKEWHTVKVFSQRMVESALALKRGDAVYVEGKIRAVEYEKDGKNVKDKQVYADFLTGLVGDGTGDPGVAVKEEVNVHEYHD